MTTRSITGLCAILLLALVIPHGVAFAQADKPNILFIVSDDTGYGDLGPYGGGEGRGMPTPSIDRIAAEGMTFFSFYAQPSCTPGRAAIQTGRIPNRSGMTTVAFQGQGVVCPRRNGRSRRCSSRAATRPISPASGISARRLRAPNAQGYDEMK